MYRSLSCAGRLLFAVGLVLLVPYSPAGAEPGSSAVALHVAAGAQPGGDGSAARPFASLQPALDAAQPGQTVIVAAGDYVGKVRSVRSGTLDAPIRLVGQPGARLSNGGASRLFEITHSHIRVSGLDLSGANILVMVSGATGVWLAANTFHDAGSECIRLRDGASGNVVSWNAISRCGLTGFNGSKVNGEGIYIGTAPEKLSGTARDASVGNWVVSNRIDAPAECVDIKEGADGTHVLANACTGGRYVDGAGYVSRARWAEMDGNWSYGNEGSGIMLTGDRDGDGVASMVTRNVLIGNGQYGLKVVHGPQLVMCGNDLRANGRAPATPLGAGGDSPC